MSAQELIDRSKAPESKLGSKADAKDDLKSLLMPEVEKTLGSSLDGFKSDKHLAGLDDHVISF